MLRGPAGSSYRRPEHHGDRHLPAHHRPHLGRLVAELVHPAGDKVVELAFRYRTQTRHGCTKGGADDRDFGNGGVPHPFFPKDL